MSFLLSKMTDTLKPLITYHHFLVIKMSTTANDSTKKTGEDCGCSSSGATYQILDDEQIKERLSALKPFWSLSEDSKFIFRHFACKHWKAAIAVVNAISEIAERKDMQHHPDISLTSYRNLEVRITTNSVNALTESDFKLAKEIDAIPVEFSPKWLKSNPDAVVVSPSETTAASSETV
jgi:4a-hydroxytetrahydrobiopterin dehydratase